MTSMMVCALVGAPGCGDEIVGYFGGSGAAGSSSSTASGSSSTTTPDDAGFAGPGCFSDDFENGTIDPLWNTWMEQDSTIAEIGGLLELTPPSFGLWDTGIVGAYNFVFPFTTGHARLRVPTPPAVSRPVLLFLKISDETGTETSMQLSGGSVSISAAIGLVEQYREDFPKATYPEWIQMRAEGAVVHFEVSDDGQTFFTLTSRDKLSDFAHSTALIMAQTAADDPERGSIGVDDFEVCVE